MYKVGLWGLSQESASCKQQMHGLQECKSQIILRGDWRCNTCGINNCLTSTYVSLQQVSHFNKCLTQQVSHFKNCLTSTCVSLQKVSHSTSVSLQKNSHFKKCFTSTSVSLNKYIISKSISLN